jgi:hypothetical protein
MAARDGASSVQGTFIRVTRLRTDGSIQSGYPVLTTKGFITASFSPQFEDGDEINEKAADGSVCVSWKADDTFTRLDFSLSLCTPDPEISALLAGGSVVKSASGDIIGYSSVPAGTALNIPVAIEVWSIANVGGKPAFDAPYWHWVFPYVKLRYEGDREFTNGMLANEFSGQALGNVGLSLQGLNPVRPTDDYVVYREALVNPFSYVRATSQPSTAPFFSGAYPATGADITPYVAPTGVTAGIPGSFTPAGATVPYNLDAIRLALPTPSPATAWTAGQYVVLGDGSQTYWNGTAWIGGSAP